MIERDDMMRALLLRWLGEAGFAAQAATLDTLAASGAPGFDLVVADVPGRRAMLPLLRALRAAHAGPLVLVSARLARGGAGALASQHGVAALLAKPCTRAELLQAVKAAL